MTETRKSTMTIYGTRVTAEGVHPEALLDELLDEVLGMMEDPNDPIDAGDLEEAAREIEGDYEAGGAGYVRFFVGEEEA